MIIETLTYLFDADISKLQKGEKTAEKDAKNLDSALGKVDKTAETLGKSFVDMIATAGGALTALLSFSALSAGIAQTSAYVDNLAKTSRLLGENINELGAYQELVVKSGGDVGGFQSSVKALNEQMNEFVVTGSTGALPFMQRLGISMVDTNGKAKKALDILPELAEKFEKLSKTESAGIGKKLGLDEGTIGLLQQGRKEVEAQLKRQKELFSITEKQAKVFEDFNDAVSDTSTAFRGLFVELGADILPIVKYFLTKIQDFAIWLKQNEKFVTGFFIALGVAITAYALPAIIKMGIAMITAFAPFYLIGGLIAGIAIAVGFLYDDIMTFLEGGNSAFGEFLKWLGLSDEKIEGVKNSIKQTGAFFKEFFSDLANIILHPIQALEDFIAMISDAIGLTGVFSKASDAVSSGMKKVKSFFGFGDDESEQTQAQAVVAGANSNPYNMVNSNILNTSRSNSNKTSNIKIEKVEVQTQATDANGISQSIGDSLSSQLKNTTATYEDGLEA